MESVALLIASTMNAGTVLAIAALGLLINERAGIVNLGAEGMMLVAAIAGFATAVHTGNDWIAFAAGAGAGALLAAIFGLLVIWLNTNQYATGLALSLFDQTRSVHGLTDREREWLEYGALLHDIGVHISYERHHRHSYYLIKNGDLRGFDPQETEVIALIARYHRQATPKKSHDGFGDLPRPLRKTVRALAAMVRLAEGLDRSHAQALGGSSSRCEHAVEDA